MNPAKKIIVVALAVSLAACQAERLDNKQPLAQGEQHTAPTPPATKQPAAPVLKKAKEEMYDGMTSIDMASARQGMAMPAQTAHHEAGYQQPSPQWNRESYTYHQENGFHAVSFNPLSTFSIDVDTASYSNVRRFIHQGSLPPVGAVRIEEMVNYFSYDYPQPSTGPFAITTEVGPCLWQPEHKLVRIGLQGKTVDKTDLPPSNLVFLIDVSGSMQAANKLPLLKKSMKMLVDQLGSQDRVAIVVYAGCDRVVLPPTSCADKPTIIEAIDNLTAGGSTNGASGIITAYELATRSLMPAGNNRIILASDGDFNVGVTSRGELQKLVEEKRKSGIFLTVLGFGMGNYHDDTMEVLADKGNGNYAYIDNLMEAKKVLVREMGGTMFAIAQDVKIQVEFNPAQVAAYRLVGYENRMLADEDFNDDTKDAGEIGVGHSVTALYELIVAGGKGVPPVDPLKYQQTDGASIAELSDELLTVKVRYKEPRAATSRLLAVPLKKGSEGAPSTDFHFASAVAGFGMLLSDSDQKGTLSYQTILTAARQGRGTDHNGYRAEFIRLVENSELLAQ